MFAELKSRLVAVGKESLYHSDRDTTNTCTWIRLRVCKCGGLGNLYQAA